MRILLLGSLLFAIQAVAPAQGIFIPFKGRKTIVRNDDRRMRDRNDQDGYIDRLGERCGDYFFFEVIGNQQIVSFGLTPTKNGAGAESAAQVERIGRQLLRIKLDDGAGIPTAEWRGFDEGHRILIRISEKHYNEASCLPVL